MTKQTVYTNYWVNRLSDLRKEHGSYKSEEDALEAIKTWWEIQKDDYRDIEVYRTNTGALEVNYGFDDYFYRIEARQIDEPLPSTSYTLRKPGQIEAERAKYNLSDEFILFDELAEPYRDRLVFAMGDARKVRDWYYTPNGKPVTTLRGK